MTDNDVRWNKITGMKVGDKLPEATFQTRVRDDSIEGPTKPKNFQNFIPHLY